jgi:hypothetical protein
MGRARFQAPDAARARVAAEAVLAARAGEEDCWSLGVLHALTAKAPGTRRYVVTYAAWEPVGERFIRRDVHEQGVWATDATSARRLASELVQAEPAYRPTWRVTGVAAGGGPARPAGRGRAGPAGAGRRGGGRRTPAASKVSV